MKVISTETTPSMDGQEKMSEREMVKIMQKIQVDTLLVILLVLFVFPAGLIAQEALPAGGPGSSAGAIGGERSDLSNHHKRYLTSREKYLKDQFTKLMVMMLRAADKLAATEPESAAAIRQAVEHAQQAFISDDMDKVIACLNKGMITIAGSTQAGVVKKLKEVLKIIKELEKMIEEEKKMFK